MADAVTGRHPTVQGGGRRDLRRGAAAKPSGWSAKAAAARPRWAGCWCAGRADRRCGSTSTARTSAASGARRCGASAPRAVIFQNPFDALNPRLTVRDSLVEPLATCRHPARRMGRAHRARPAAGAAAGGRALPATLSAPALRRATAAGGDGARPDPRPRASGRRRAGLDARCHRARRDPQRVPRRARSDWASRRSTSATTWPWCATCATERW